MSSYIWQRSDWPRFRWDAAALLSVTADVRFRHGRFLGTMAAAGLATRQEAELSAVTADAIASSAIEGETLPPASVRASIARRLGLPAVDLAPLNREAEGMANILLDATQNFRLPLTATRIWGWHHALFAGSAPERQPIDIGRWRSDALGRMQIVSSVYSGGKAPRIHFEAPPAAQLSDEMAAFFTWFNATATVKDDLVRAAVAHLWFVTIHPLDDGNGRIGRAIADMAIAQAEGSGQRFYSLSRAILQDRRGYYAALETASRGDLDITEWLLWFLRCHGQAIEDAEGTATRVIKVARFWAAMDGSDPPLNDRQRKMITRLLEGCEGLLTTKKWVAMFGCSADTAQRDMADLNARGLLKPNAKRGRSSGYHVTLAID